MSKKLYGALLSVLAVVAFATMTSSAMALPHWYSNGVKISEGTAEKPNKVQVITWGTLTLENAALGKVICKVSDAGNVWNPAGGGNGLDEIVLFDLYECTSATCEGTVTVTAALLPWLTELVAGPPIRDRVKGISVTVKCTKPVVEATFTGELTPEIVNGTSAAKPSFAEFGAGSGELEGPVGIGKAKISGKDKFLGFNEQELITVKNP